MCKRRHLSTYLKRIIQRPDAVLLLRLGTKTNIQPFLKFYLFLIKLISLIFFLNENYCLWWHLQSYIYWDLFTLILIWHRLDFNPLKYSRDVNSHPERKTVFTQALELQERKFKLNPCNASAEARTTSLTEWL